jgi:hypothetical protein
MVLGVYTKGIHGLLVLPGLLIYAAAVGRFKAVFRQRKVYAAAAMALLIIGTYYITREQLEPGYLHAVWENELFGRYAAVNEGHSGNFLYYLATMRWWTVILICALPALFVTNGADKRVGVFTIIMAACYLLVISLSKTKLQWYATPVYPFLSLFTVVALRTLITWLRPKAAWTWPALIALTCGATLSALSAMVIKVDENDHPRRAEERYPDQLAAFRDAFPGTNSMVLGTPSYQGPGLYYQKYFAKRGLFIERQRLGRLHLQPSDTILTSVEPIKRILRDDYDTKTIFLFEGMEGQVIRKAHPPHPRGNSYASSPSLR